MELWGGGGHNEILFLEIKTGLLKNSYLKENKPRNRVLVRTRFYTIVSVRSIYIQGVNYVRNLIFILKP